MTTVGGLGCALVGVGPSLILFIFTVANSPIKVILLTASGFFWLFALLLSSVVWFAVVPLRSEVVFGLVVAVLVQELMRFAFYILIRKADAGLQVIAANASAVALDSPNGDSIGDPFVGAGANTTPMPNPLGNIARRAGVGGLLNQRIVAYVAGLGFGLMSCIVELMHILLQSSGPGINAHDWEGRTFFVVASFESTCISLLQIFWSLILFNAFDEHSYFRIAVVLLSHLCLSCLSLLNDKPTPWPELVCVAFALSLIATVVFAYFALGGRRPVLVRRATPSDSQRSSN